MEEELEYDLDHVRTYMKYAYWLNYSKVAVYCEVSTKNISDFVHKTQRGKPVGLHWGRKALFNFLKNETTYDPNRQYDAIM
jgi:hypothetical protein